MTSRVVAGAPSRRLLWRIDTEAHRASPNGPTVSWAAAGSLVYPPGGSFGPLVRRAYTLTLLFSGGLVITVEGQPHHLAAGEVALLAPGYREHYQFAADRESHQGWLSLYRYAIPEAHVAALESAPFSLPISPAMENIVNTIAALCESPASTDATLVALVAAALVLYAEEARAHGDQRQRERLHPAIAAARALVQQELHRPLSLRDLAAAAHIAPEYLVRLFRKQLGMTPMQYLWHERIQLGVYLLEHTGLPIAEIAERTGFQTPKHFAQRVRTATGYPPRQLRLRRWSMPSAPEG